MTDDQLKVIIGSLVAIGIVLPLVMLNFGNYSPFHQTGIISFASQGTMYGSSYWGIYTSHGLMGVVLGVIVPLCLLAGAAFLWFGRKPALMGLRGPGAKPVKSRGPALIKKPKREETPNE